MKLDYMLGSIFFILFFENLPSIAYNMYIRLHNKDDWHDVCLGSKERVF